MSTLSPASLNPLNKIYSSKLQRLERQYIKKTKEKERSEALLTQIKEDICRAEHHLEHEKKAWYEKIQQSEQSKQTLLEMRYELHLLKERVTELGEKANQQQKEVTDLMRITGELKQSVKDINIKLEKLSLLQSEA